MHSSKKTETSSLSPSFSILVTSGGTKEPIDGIRYISNVSQGTTGSSIAEELFSKGFQVTFLYAKGSYFPSSLNLKNKNENQRNFQSFSFETFSDFKSTLTNLLSNYSYQVIIHSAALSDFSIQSIQQGEKILTPNKDLKLPSQTENMVLHLKRNEKLLLKLKEISKINQKKSFQFIGLKKPPFIFGFKLTHGLKAKTRFKMMAQLLQTDKVDFIIHNDFHEISKIKKKINFLKARKELTRLKDKENLSKDFHIFRLYKQGDLKKPIIFLSKKSLARGLSKLIFELKSSRFKSL